MLLPKLAVHGDVPLVRVRTLVGVDRSVQDALAVLEVGLDERGPFEVLGQPLLEEERRLDAAEAGVERGRGREPVLRNATAPAGIERLRVEDPPAAAEDGLVGKPVDGAEPRREPAVEILFGITGTIAGRSPFVTRKGQAPRPPAGARIGANRIEERETIVLLRGRRVVIPAQPVVERELVGHGPGVTGEQDPRVLTRIRGVHRAECRIGAVDGTDEEAGHRAAAVDCRQGRSTRARR